MGSSLKRHVVNKVYASLRSRSSLITCEQLMPQIVVGNLKRTNPEYYLTLPLNFQVETDREIESLQLNSCDLETDNVIQSVGLKALSNQKKVVCISVEKKRFIKDVLDSEPTSVNFPLKRENVLIDFSSPNIAKPFHAGHLRSTIIGNFISNLKNKLNKNVKRINFLGDWGTQFGMLKYGVDSLNLTDDMIQKDPINLLYQAYVAANNEAKMNSDINSEARRIFQELESENSEYLEDWNKFRSYTVIALNRIYKRLGLTFDDYLWESDYGKQKIENLFDILKSQGVMTEDENGRIGTRINERFIPLKKSDGTTLYLTRDIASAIERHTKYSSDESLYVVENGQSDHFSSLFTICKNIHLRNHWRMKHVKFGRIHGMSSRKGQVVFLTDILDEARSIMYQKQKDSPTTKVEVTEEIADILGISAVIINDLKQRRQKDYQFSWEKAVQTNGDTGIKLQYTHCRLYSLLQNSGATLPRECDPNVLLQPEAVALVYEIAKFEEVLYRANEELEACILVSYLFNLCAAVNRAFKTLAIKGQDSHTASQRLLLFNTARKILGEGMKILGLQPLNQM